MGTVLNRHLSKNLEYLFAELNRIKLKLRLQALHARSRDSYWDRDELRGLYISSRELSALITDGRIEEQDTTLHSTTDPNYEALLETLERFDRANRKDSCDLKGNAAVLIALTFLTMEDLASEDGVSMIVRSIDHVKKILGMGGS